ncbi:peptidase M28 [alpha proteobacterium AAP81b]|nr:peptidase M28 [alpha proteobacterium AAP81b]
MRFLSAGVALGLLAAPLAAEPQFSPERIKADVGFLADDLLEGRDTGSRGHEIAARYVAAQFAAAGLKPGGSQGWFTPVTLSEASLGDGASLTVSGKAGSQSFAQRVDVLMTASHREAASDVSAPLVFVGWGLDDPAYGYNDYKGLDVRGKIVVMLRGIPKGAPDEVVAHLANQKAVRASARGAIGVIAISSLQSERTDPFAKRLAGQQRPSTTWVKADGQAFDAASNVRGNARVGDKAAQAIFAEARTPLATVLAEADKPGGRPKGFALATSARFTFASTQRRIVSPNVVGVIPGSDPALKDEVVVLMGHLDHIGIKANAAPGADRIFNGALDNAAGSAVMLEAARAFAAEAPPKRTLMFIANTGEERGLLGAEATANMPPVAIDRIVAAVDLDMPLLLYPFTDVIAFGGDHSTIGSAIAKAVGVAGVAVSPDPMPEETIFVRSDHYAFVKRGVPAIMLATGYASGGEAAWKSFLSTHYHNLTDDMALPIDWASAARYARVNYLITRELADAAERPRWYAGDYFGNAFAAGAPRAVRAAK